MLTPATQRAILRWVAVRFDLPPEAADQLAAPGARVQPHGPRLARYRGVYCWLLGETADAATISAPAEVMADVRRAIAGQASTTLDEPEFWRAALGARVERIVGPSYQGFCDADSFRPANTQGARLLTPADQPALARFVAACPPDDWRDSAIASDHLIYGVTAQEAVDELVALASVAAEGATLLPGGVYSIGVATLPAWRGRGAGHAVVSALTAQCLAAGALPHYQTLRANHAALALARTLGYADVATALAVRLNS